MISRRVTRAGLLLLVGWFVLSLAGRAVGVRAHALLDHSEPPADARLTQAPAELVLYFAQAVMPDVAYSYVLLRDSKGDDVPLHQSFDANQPKVIRAVLPLLPADVYSVKWQTRSADDDDIADGSYKITVLNADGSPPPAAGAPNPPATVHKAGSSGPLVAVAGVAGVLLVAVGLWWWRRKGRAL